MYKWLRIFCFLLLLCAFSNAFTQLFTTKVSATTIGKKDVLQIEYVADNVEIDQFTMPALNIWNVLSGPNMSSSTVQSGNMVKQQTIYSVMVLPKLTGTLVVPGATALINNMLQCSNSIAVIVQSADHVAGAKQPQQQAPTPPSIFDDLDLSEQTPSTQYLKKGEKAIDKIRSNILIRLEVSKHVCYVGEPILATYKLCSRLRSKVNVVKQPTFSGCTVIEMTENDPKQHVERINGKDYSVFVFRKVQLIPLDAGVLVLPATSVENTVAFYDARKLSYSDLFYGNPSAPAQEQTVILQNKPESIQVKPLPALSSVKNDFSGALGRFDISVTTNNAFATNKTNNLLVTIEGKGNLQQMKPPAIVFPKGIESFEPVVKDEAAEITFPVTSKRTYCFPFIADREGRYAMPAIELTYFDAATSQYVTKATHPFILNVAKGNKNILHVFNRNGDAEAFQTRLMIIAGGAILLVLAGLFWYNGRRKSQQLPVAKSKAKEEETQHAYKPEMNEFVFKIRELQPETDIHLFYKQLYRHLKDFTMSRFMTEPEQLELYIQKHPADAASLQQLQQLLNHCSIGRYTPVYSLEEAMQHRLQAIDVVNRFT